MVRANNQHYDLCIIGAGPGGFAGAMRAVDAGKRVCLIEKGEIGGTGVKWGALASKTMWELAKDYAVAAKKDRGYLAKDLQVDYQAVRSTVMQAVKEKQYQMFSQLQTYSPEAWPGPGSVVYKQGIGSFVTAKSIQITLDDGRKEIVSSDFFLVATGSSPKDFHHIPVDQDRILNSDGVLELKAFPKRLMIIGAGVTGCEYATIFSNFDQTQVYLVDHQQQVLPYEDDDIIKFVSANLSQNGVQIIHSAVLKDIIKKPDHLEVILTFSDGHVQVVEVDTVLISIGREPSLEKLNLEKAGIAPDEHGYLICDDNCCVKNHIYAAGDVTHRPALVNMAVMESRYAVKHMFQMNKYPLEYRNMSTVMFFYPAVAAVGLNEKACQRKKIPYRVASYANSLLSRAIAMRATTGFAKIIISDDEKQKILGMRAAGPQVSNTIMSIALLIDQNKGIKEVLKSMYPHPTMSEGIQECLRLHLDKSVYKPRAFPDLLSVKVWHPDKGYVS
ncbi:MAG: NAD(P)/FAD-dependent oxidoreductase [Desulfobacteraceae bacterium]|nr:NAD(P)/FAD-dependent oxidoreductase [Desulfobacteraceae bacterium]